MLDWVEQHSALLQVGTSALMALIWIGYLQLFLMNFVRQRRPMIMIELGAGIGLAARCFVANLSFEPIYVLHIYVRLVTDDSDWTAVVTQRTELSEEKLKDPTEASNQGPMKSGDYYDFGSFDDLLTRARLQSDEDVVTADLRSAEITVIASTASSADVVAARRTYLIEQGTHGYRLRPTTVQARQVRSFLNRWRLKRRLKAAL